MNPSEIPLDSSEVGDLVGACVPWALSAHAGVIVDTIVGAIVGELVSAVVADNVQSQKCECGDEHRIHSSKGAGGWVQSHCPNLNRTECQGREQHMLAEDL